MSVAAAIQYGQMVERNWLYTPESGAPEGHCVIDSGDKQTVRQNLLQCVYQAQGIAKIIKQYTRSLKIILRADFPEQWPTFVDECMQYIS